MVNFGSQKKILSSKNIFKPISWKEFCISEFSFEPLKSWFCGILDILGSNQISPIFWRSWNGWSFLGKFILCVFKTSSLSYCKISNISLRAYIWSTFLAFSPLRNYNLHAKLFLFWFRLFYGELNCWWQ